MRYIHIFLLPTIVKKKLFEWEWTQRIISSGSIVEIKLR